MWDSNPRGLFTLHDFQSCSLGHYETPPARRREWDSNPRGLFTLPLFESGTFDHSDISPLRSIAYLQNQGKHRYLSVSKNGLAWRRHAQPFFDTLKPILFHHLRLLLKTTAS